MHVLRRALHLSIPVLLLAGVLATARATPLAPQTPSRPPLPPSSSSTVEFFNEPSTSARAPLSLKAVLLVGPIDGDHGAWTNQEKQNMDLAAAELEANGVQVFKFYAPNNDWEQIKAAADGAHFFFYRGHGVYWSAMPTPIVGGFALKDYFVSSDDIRNDLNLAPNAIVMLYGCFTAGSSSIDGGPITSQEAQRRVAQYSDPFFDKGAAGYYANWFGDAFQMYLHYLFQGMTLGEAYEAFFDFNSATVENYFHPDHPEQVMWLDKDVWGYTQYNNAFGGLPDLTLSDLFKPDEMTLTSSALTHLAEPSSPAHSFSIQVDSTGTHTFPWTASISSAETTWLDVSPSSGLSGQWMTAVITPTGKALGTYQAYIHVAAGTSELENGEQDIAVTLRIVDRVHAISLPMVVRGTP